MTSEKENITNKLPTEVLKEAARILETFSGTAVIVDRHPLDDENNDEGEDVSKKNKHCRVCGGHNK